MNGNEDDAQEALLVARDWLNNGVTAKGWYKVGVGAYRSVWTKDGVTAYKVAHPTEPDSNEPEYLNYVRWGDRLPEGVRFPAMEDFYVEDLTGQDVLVLAVEIVRGEKGAPGLIDLHNEFITQRMGLFDCWSSNVMAEPDGTLVLLDFAF